ncbi:MULTISPECIES: glycosyltransferase [Alphaproteobacteria]|uniref:glycosyltransferase n=2 Tax=Pseudomonadota TaxID=1224 RepID=UPI0032990163
MTLKVSNFWRDLVAVQTEGEAAKREPVLERLHQFIQSDGSELQASRARMLDETLQAFRITTPSLGQGENVEPDFLGPIVPTGEDGISVVTCAMNRTKNLLSALKSWVGFGEISEIVIVDWSSDVPIAQSLSDHGIDDPRIRILRVEGEPRWILSYAFNVGFRAARYDKILKVDADLLLMPDFFALNPLPERSFIAGNWRTAKPDQAHVNGFFFVTRGVLAKVAGFNEFITTYGWDDDDLYQRLNDIGAKRIDVTGDTIHHQEHSDAERTGTQHEMPSTVLEEITSSTMYCIRRNRFLANVMPLWNRDRELLPFNIIGSHKKVITLKRTGHKPHSVPEAIWEDAQHYALAEMASWRFGPSVLSVPRNALSGLLDRPAADVQIDLISSTEFSPAAPQITSPRPRFFIDAQHGLGNRMRAIGSAAAIAEATERELVVVWEPDHHCEGRMSDLFEYNGALIEESFAQDAWGKGCILYNYMEIEQDAHKDAPLDLSWGGDIYARAAYVLNAEPSTWEHENRFLRALKPVEFVRNLVASVRTPNDVSAHIRMVGAPGSDGASYDRADNWTTDGHAAINYWREKSHYSHFLSRIDLLIGKGRADRVFVAADALETYEVFHQVYGDRVVYLERELYDRSSEQLQYALADALLLGQTSLLLGSNWSSFTELAMRMTPNPVELEISGKDF